MKKTIPNSLLLSFTYAIVCIFSINLQAQSVGVSTGFGYSTFFDLEKNNNYTFANYERGSYQFLRLDLDSYIPEANFLSLYFKLEKNVGAIESREGFIRFCGMFDPLTIPADINARITLYKMSIGFMPINFSIYKNVRFKAGTELSRVFKSSFTARTNDSAGKDTDVFLPRNSNVDFIRDYGAGFIFELQLGKYSFGKDLTIYPIYNSSISLTEDITTGFYTRALRQSLGVAVKWNMKPKLLMP